MVAEPRRTLREVVSFVVVGVLNTAFGYAVFVALILIGAPEALSLLTATAAGVLFNFFTIGSLVFGNRGIRLLSRFVLVYAVLYGANLALLKGGMALGLGPLVSQAMCLVPVSTASFILNKFVVFRASGSHEADQHRHAVL